VRHGGAVVAHVDAVTTRAGAVAGERGVRENGVDVGEDAVSGIVGNPAVGDVERAGATDVDAARVVDDLGVDDRKRVLGVDAAVVDPAAAAVLDDAGVDGEQVPGWRPDSVTD